MRVDEILACIKWEVEHAEAKHPPMHSAHEGHSVIREEFEELWEHVRADTGRSTEAMLEAIQTAAMCVRYIRDVVHRRQDDRARAGRAKQAKSVGNPPRARQGQFTARTHASPSTPAHPVRHSPGRTPR